MKLKAFLISIVSLLIFNRAVSAPLVETPVGLIEGEELNGVEVFKGIPYAQTVTEELRFAPPVAASPFKEKFKAD
ncbi:MAG: carboxylesterase family protein, partial [Succinivibrio sp.]|nr:carboxylesterase family protein [Succinivibrio sp.]